MQQIPVSDLMRPCAFAVVSESMRLREAAEILVLHDYPVLVAEDDSGRICGIVPESAVIRELMTNSRRDVTVASILSRHVESVRADARLTSVLHLFRESCHAVVPAVDESGHIVGLLYRHDIVRLLLSNSDADFIASESQEPRGTAVQKPHFLDRQRRRRKSESADGSAPDGRMA